MFRKTYPIIMMNESRGRGQLKTLMAGLLLITAGCHSLSEDRMAQLNRTADRSTTQLMLERAGVQWELNNAAGYVVAEIDRRVIPSGYAGMANGVLVRPADDARFYMQVSGLKFDGAEGVKQLTAIILLSDPAELQQALAGTLEINPSAKTRRIFVSADKKRFAVYYLESARFTPIRDYSSEAD